MMKRDGRRKNDLLLLAAFLAAGGIIALILFLGGSGGGGRYAEVRVSGKTVMTLPLDRDAEIDIEGYGGGTNHLVIEDGKAWISEASCPDGLCVKMGKIGRNGQSVVCLPNRVVVEITEDQPETAGESGEQDTDGLDAVAGWRMTA